MDGRKLVFLLRSALLLTGIFAAAAAQAAEPALFQGPPVTKAEDLAAYTGLNAAARIVGDWRVKAFCLNYEQLAVNYGENVDFQLRKRQILLTPQTADFLYQKYIPVPRDAQGSRPELEKVVAQATVGCRTTEDKVLALMRYCRDLKKTSKVAPGNPAWRFGGTEEELIAKGEDLCETLGRLFVALCEVVGIPARIVMHDVGGHITAEAYIDGAWAYLDPRFGIYFRKPDGRLASLWELMRNPALTLNQPAAVKAEVAGRFTWEQRAEKCRKIFFNPLEINGFEYYSLADVTQFRYGKVTDSQARDRGLFELAAVYAALSDQVFGKESRIADFFWTRKPLRPLPLTWRNDGYSSWYEMTPPFAPQTVERREIAPLADSPFDTLIWGTGPGSTFTHRTRAGEIFGYAVSDEEWKTQFNPGDRHVHDGIKGLIEQGIDPQAMIAELGHKHKLKVLSRLEMNHEYPILPGKNGRWMWHGFNGELCKRHPEYHVSKTNPNLNYSHAEVREFKLAILRELAQSGVDGIEVDFSVYPPFFVKPDAEIMTNFVRAVRVMLDEEGRKQHKRLTLQIVVPNVDALAYGLDWPRWMREKLVDSIVPGYAMRGVRKYAFDSHIEEFIRVGKEFGVPVSGFLDQSLRIFSQDQDPDGIRRYARGKRPEEFYAQALIYMRSGVDRLQLGMPESNRYVQWKAMFDSLGTPEAVEFADKNYITDPFFEFPPLRPDQSPSPQFYTATQALRLRVADDIETARARRIVPRVMLVLNMRKLQPGETLEVFINGFPIGGFSGDSQTEQKRYDGVLVPQTDADLQVPNWWKRGARSLEFPAEKLWLGENIIRVVYSASNPLQIKPLYIHWPEIQLRYPAAAAAKDRP